MDRHHIRTDYADLPEDWHREPEPRRRLPVVLTLAAVLAVIITVLIGGAA